MTSMDSILMRQRVLTRQRKDVEEAIALTRDPWDGKTLGMKISDEVRGRLDAQESVWKLKTRKHAVMAAMMLGLKQMETLSQLGKAPEPKKYESATNVVEDLPEMEVHNTVEDPIAELMEG